MCRMLRNTVSEAGFPGGSLWQERPGKILLGQILRASQLAHVVMNSKELQNAWQIPVCYTDSCDPRNTSASWFYYHPHFTDEETDATQRLSNLPKVTWRGRRGTRTHRLSQDSGSYWHSHTASHSLGTFSFYLSLKLSFKAGVPSEQIRKAKLIKMGDSAQPAGCRAVI